MHGSRRSCGRRCFSAALVLAFAACTQLPGSDVHATNDPLVVPRNETPPATLLAGASAPPTAPEPLPVRAKSIGHTSYVLKVTLSDGMRGVFKPRSRRPLGDRRYRGEIAAYRLARALGLDNVPRAVPRAFPLASLRAACATSPGGAEQLDREVLVDADGTVRGAFIDWIDDYRELPVENSWWRARWEPWLLDSRAKVGKNERTLATAISTMIVFDYVIANWDRYSGGNVARDGDSGSVLFVDNDGAFYESPPAEPLARQFGMVRRVVRFSRQFVTALRALDKTKLEHIFGEESPGKPLLPRSAVIATDERRRRAIKAIDAHLATRGEQTTLAFE
jgi:hypothetical protein